MYKKEAQRVKYKYSYMSYLKCQSYNCDMLKILRKQRGEEQHDKVSYHNLPDWGEDAIGDGIT